MPLLDIATSQPFTCLRNNTIAFRFESHFRNNLVVCNDKGLGLSSTFSWRTSCIPIEGDKNVNLKRFEVCRSGLMIRAVATVEVDKITHKNEGVKGYQEMLRLSIDSVRSDTNQAELEERERLRRMRISEKNKGNTPWNKGRKHSPETLQRIKERTRLAMQDPKVKMKLVNLGHAQSEETRLKIGVGVRLGWDRRREKLMLQETCHYRWQDLIAEASRKGLSGEEEFQWDSYKILNKQLEKEWLQSVEERKNTPRLKGSMRAPKPADHKRKIAEAIAAKWADPEYRSRVFSGRAKFHSISDRVERKSRRKLSDDAHNRKRSPKKKDEANYAKHETKSQIHRVRSKRNRAPLYKDPFASSKLEMLKTIRAQRVATAMNENNEAISRAKSVIVEAERAAEALEIAAQNCPNIRRTLIESRMLIAEAIQFVKSMENESQFSLENNRHLLENSAESLPHFEEGIDANTPTFAQSKVNGAHSLSTRDIKVEDMLNGNASYFGETEQKSHQMSSNSLLSFELKNTVSFGKNSVDPNQSPNGSTEKPLVKEVEFKSEDAGQKNQVRIIKKWLRGRLVEVVEDNLA